MAKIFIKSVEKLAESQGFKTLKNIKKKEIIFLVLIYSQEWTIYTMTTKQMIYKRIKIKNILITIKLI